jgi:DNA-binding SARP family transcriptional activator
MPEEALAVFRKGLAQDYYREELHHGAFRAYARLALYGQLEAHYNELREVLRREFDTAPDPITEQLYRQLMAKRAS